MWKIRFIECENFISFQDAGVDIPQNVCTLIYGLNNDNMQQRNNGTGKSSIIEAIAFALTGEPLRSVDKAEEIINDNSDTANVYMELYNDYDKTVLTIERTLSRKSPQVIQCHKYNEQNDEIDQTLTSQPTVADYNRYILEEIGLTKDDIYSNFILSNSKYKSFFDAGDKAKKALINRFSGADKIDEVIETLQKDRQPAEDALNKAKDNKIAVEAKLEVVEGQLADADNKKAEWAADKKERIKNINQQIAQKREGLRQTKETIAKANDRLGVIDKVGDYIENELQNSKESLSDIYKDITHLFEDNKLEPIKDYVALCKKSENAIAEYGKKKKPLEEDLANLQKSAEEAEKALKEQQKQLTKLQTDTDTSNKASEADIVEIQKDIDDTRSKSSKLAQDISDAKKKVDNVSEKVRKLQNQIHGAITCPKCKHEFFVDSDITLEEAKEQLAKETDCLTNHQQEESKLQDKQDKYKTQLAGFEKELDEVEDEIHQRKTKLSSLRRAVNGSVSEFEKLSSEVAEAKRKVNAVISDIEVEQGKIDGLVKNMLSEALDIVDNAYDKGENYINTLKDKLTSINASIESFEKTLEEAENSSQDDFVASLNSSKAKYEKELQTALKELQMAQEEYDKYVVQENHFVDFRSYLANKKVKAISGITNHFLELIGSDLRVEMLGFKKLKNGKIRDKITVNLLRNGVDCGSYAKFSGGERARVNLASILGLQRLTNNSAPKGKGLDLIILDEILSESDAEGINAMSNALNRLKATSLLVVQDTVCNDYDNVIIVEKHGGYSYVSWK